MAGMMPGNSIFTREGSCALALALFIPFGGAQATAFTTLYSFTGGSDGSFPEESLLLGKTGSLYGTTFTGDHNHGTVFELAPGGTQSVLHTFHGYKGGANPIAALVRDKRGDLYGTTVFGGGGCNCGVVLRLKPDGTEKVLYVFQGVADGIRPRGELIRDNVGNLYGATEAGGSGCGCGTVFKLQPDGTEVVLHTFSEDDGEFPDGDLIRDEPGNIYGVTEFGGAGDCNCGVVFKLAPDGTETVLHRFSGKDGAYPRGGVIADDAGNLYGVTYSGGASDCTTCGTVFRIAMDGTETVLHSFAGGVDGSLPMARLLADSAGNLYGTTYTGGGGHCHTRHAGKGCGTVFKIAPDGTETIMHAFQGKDGSRPLAGLIADRKGNLYGTTSDGGPFDSGTIFRLDE